MGDLDHLLSVTRAFLIAYISLRASPNSCDPFESLIQNLPPYKYSTPSISCGHRDMDGPHLLFVSVVSLQNFASSTPVPLLNVATDTAFKVANDVQACLLISCSLSMCYIDPAHGSTYSISKAIIQNFENWPSKRSPAPKLFTSLTRIRRIVEHGHLLESC